MCLIFFPILNFVYFIKKVKRIHVKLWLIEYKVRQRICIPYVYIGLWNYIIKKWVNCFSSWICSGYECSMFQIFSSLLNLSSSVARLLCWDFTLGFCIVWKLTQKMLVLWSSAPAESCNELMAYSLVLSCCCYTCNMRRKLRKMLNITVLSLTTWSVSFLVVQHEFDTLTRLDNPQLLVSCICFKNKALMLLPWLKIDNDR